jgi:putative membrane protein
MIRFVYAFVGAVALAYITAGIASAQQSTSPPAATATQPPSAAIAASAAASAGTFVPTASSANLFEIESSQLALQRSQSSKVKDFAQRMVTDHNMAASKMKQALSDAKIVPPPEKLNAKDQKAYDNLKAVAPTGFDKAYIEAQYMAHVEAVNLFTAYSKNGDNPRLKALAADLLPTLQGHLDHISKLRSS